jgi:TetR/AcrR family transcriptional repressor of nem operon
MPWDKRFDEEEVLDAAMTLFWERGYQGVSMADLVSELGVSRSSLYDTFGQKEDLFRRALLRYDRVHRQEWFAGLAARFDPLESIRQAFAEVAATPGQTRRFGCLLVNTTIDQPLEHSDFAGIVRAAFDETQQFFEHQLDLAKDRTELPTEVDTASLGAALMALFLGMRVLARAQRPSEAVMPILRQVDTMLET